MTCCCVFSPEVAADPFIILVKGGRSAILVNTSLSISRSLAANMLLYLNNYIFAVKPYCVSPFLSSPLNQEMTLVHSNRHTGYRCWMNGTLKANISFLLKTHSLSLTPFLPHKLLYLLLPQFCFFFFVLNQRWLSEEQLLCLYYKWMRKFWIF